MDLSKSFRVERVGDKLVVELGGRIGSLSGPELITQRQLLIDKIREPNTVAVIVNFANVEYLGSFVLDTLCVIWKQLTARSGEMCLCNLSDVAQEIVDKSRLSSLWPIYPSLEEALRALTSDEYEPPFDPAADSAVLPSFRDDSPSRLKVIKTGFCTVVGFAGGNLPPEHVVSRYLDEILCLIDEHGAQEFAFDMMGVSHVPSGFLGMVSELVKRGVHVVVKNPSDEIRDVFEISHLDLRVKLSNGA